MKNIVHYNNNTLITVIIIHFCSSPNKGKKKKKETTLLSKVTLKNNCKYIHTSFIKNEKKNDNMKIMKIMESRLLRRNDKFEFGTKFLRRTMDHHVLA